MTTLELKLTRKPLQLGFLYIPKEEADLFPSTGETSITIEAILGDEEVELRYSPKYRRLYGLTDYYRKHNAQLGDTIKVEFVEPHGKYRFSFEESSTSHELVKPILRRREASALVGPPINFRGFVYAPVNENGVIFLFSKVAGDLGITVEGIQVKFPDAFGKRYDNDRGYPVTMEFEYRSSEYKRHGHPKEGCDLVVCWEHDWKQCPIEVIELRSLIKKLVERQ